MSPLQLTVQGRKDHYSEIDDLSEEAEDNKRWWMEASVGEMKEKFPVEQLSADVKAGE